MRAAGEY
jgi:putative endonuclease